MGYYAEFEGGLVFENSLSKETQREITRLIDEAMPLNQHDWPTDFSLYFSGSGNYGEDNVKEALIKISETAEIKEGDLEYSGEFDSYWRFIFQDSKWHEQNGNVVYAGPLYDL